MTNQHQQSTATPLNTRTLVLYSRTTVMSHVRLDYIPVVSNSVVNGHATHVRLDYIPEVSHSVVNDHATIA